MGKETNIEIEYSATTFVPSYERKQQKEGTDAIFYLLSGKAREISENVSM